jgi:hypothetical protein
MKEVSKNRIDRMFEEGTPIDEALNRAVRRAVLLHKKLGYPVCAWRDGKVVWIPPEEIPGPDEEEKLGTNGAP